eukprot:308283-Chlamydomonas_euryale.AAC.1
MEFGNSALSGHGAWPGVGTEPQLSQLALVWPTVEQVGRAFVLVEFGQCVAAEVHARQQP